MSLQLLLFICGSKDKYRQLRDMHALDTHMRQVQSMCAKAGLDRTVTTVTSVSLPYDGLISLVSHIVFTPDGMTE